MSERERTTDAERQHGTRSDLTRILETLETLPGVQKEPREQGRLLETLTACKPPDAVQQGEHGSRR